MVPLVVVVLVVAVAAVAPLIARYDPDAIDPTLRAAAPSGAHWL